MPSRPVRPPSTTTRSPGCGPVGQRPVGGDADAAAEHERVGGVSPGRRARRRRRSAGRSCCRSRRRRRRRRRGCGGGAATPSGSVGDRQVGRAEAQHVGDGDRPVARRPCTSRMTPPTPVLAPPNGSTADGWLWVSALRASVVPGDERRRCRRCRRTPSARTARRRRRWRRAAGRAAAARVVPSAAVIAARNVLWAQCSLHVWASVSSSTSVGSRPLGTEVVADRRPAPRGRGPAPARRRARARPASSRSRIGIDRRRARRRRCPGGRPGSTGAGVQCSMIGLAIEPAQQHVGVAASVPVGNSMRRPVAAAPTATPSWRRGVDDGVGGGVGHAGVERDLDVPVVVGGHVPRAGLQQRVGEERAEASAVVVVEVALDEHHVGDAGSAVEGQRRATRRRRRSPSRGGRRRGIAGSVGPVPHWPDLGIARRDRL